MTKNFTVSVHNVPAYASNHPYIVARFVNGGFWFWGAYDSLEKAQEAEFETGGVIFYNP